MMGSLCHADAKIADACWELAELADQHPSNVHITLTLCDGQWKWFGRLYRQDMPTLCAPGQWSAMRSVEVLREMVEADRV